MTGRNGTPLIGEFICKCKYCSKEYDLLREKDRARRQQCREIKCPNCRKTVATIN